MLKRIFRDILIVSGLILLWASTSRTAMKYLSDKRDNNTWWGTYQCLNGDLVSMAHLDAVARFNPRKLKQNFKQPAYEGTRKTDLYLDGDSHTWHLDITNFAGLSAFHYFERTHGYRYHLDKDKKSILLIEISERYLQSYFSAPNMFDEVYDTSSQQKNSLLRCGPRAEIKQYASLFESIGLSELFNKNINQNLECNLFNYNFIMPMFEYKAALNYYAFNRASGDVVISNDRKFLFYKETVSRTDVGSSYYAVTADDKARIVDILNKVYDHYKAAGFSEIYISIVPNSASIMQPDGYNNLIPDIQNDPRLRMKVIDIYTVFKKSKELYFLPGDTHWNFKGKQLWLDVVNERLLQDTAAH